MNLDIRRCKFYLFLLPSCLPPPGEAIPSDLFPPPLMHQMTKEHEENIQWIISKKWISQVRRPELFGGFLTV